MISLKYIYESISKEQVIKKILDFRKKSNSKSNFCITVSKSLSEMYPEFKYKTGYFIYDIEQEDEGKHVGITPKLVINNDIKNKIKSVLHKNIPIHKLENYLWYHAWNEIKINEILYIIDLTAFGFDWLLKSKPPYYKYKIVIIPKNSNFGKRYIDYEVKIK